MSSIDDLLDCLIVRLNLHFQGTMNFNFQFLPQVIQWQWFDVWLVVIEHQQTSPSDEERGAEIRLGTEEIEDQLSVGIGMSMEFLRQT